MTYFFLSADTRGSNRDYSVHSSKKNEETNRLVVVTSVRVTIAVMDALKRVFHRNKADHQEDDQSASPGAEGGSERGTRFADSTPQSPGKKKDGKRHVRVVVEDDVEGKKGKIRQTAEGKKKEKSGPPSVSIVSSVCGLLLCDLLPVW